MQPYQLNRFLDPFNHKPKFVCPCMKEISDLNLVSFIVISVVLAGITENLILKSRFPPSYKVIYCENQKIMILTKNNFYFF